LSQLKNRSWVASAAVFSFRETVFSRRGHPSGVKRGVVPPRHRAAQRGGGVGRRPWKFGSTRSAGWCQRPGRFGNRSRQTSEVRFPGVTLLTGVFRGTRFALPPLGEQGASVGCRSMPALGAAGQQTPPVFAAQRCTPISTRP